MCIALAPMFWDLRAFVRGYHSYVISIFNYAFANANGSIVSNFRNNVWTFVWVRSEFCVLILFYEDFVPDLVVMGNSLRVLSRVVLFDKFLFAILCDELFSVPVWQLQSST